MVEVRVQAPESLLVMACSAPSNNTTTRNCIRSAGCAYEMTSDSYQVGAPPN